MNKLMQYGGKSLQLGSPSLPDARHLAPSALKSFARRTDLSPRFGRAPPAGPHGLGYRLA